LAEAEAFVRRVVVAQKVAERGVGGGRRQGKCWLQSGLKRRQSVLTVVCFPAIAPMKLYSKQSLYEEE
jgi:hypothetical protein